MISQTVDECPLNIDSHGTNLCPMYRRLDKAIEATETILRETTLADILSQPGSVTPLCEEQNLISVGTQSGTKKGKRKPAQQEG